MSPPADDPSPAPYPSPGLRNATHSRPPALDDMGGRPARLYFAAGVVAPWVGAILWAGYGAAASPEWQSGRLFDWVALLMGPPGSMPFWPLLLLATWAVSMVASDPKTHGRSPSVRLGLIVGIVLGVQYTLLIWAVAAYGFIAGTVIACTLLVRADSQGGGDLPKPRNPDGVGVSASVGCSLLVLAVWTLLIPAGFGTDAGESSATVGLFLFAGLVASWPAVLVVVCVQILRRIRNSAAQHLPEEPASIPAIPAAGTAAIYLGAWAFAIGNAIMKYESLPLKPPPDDCYVANAACRGHRRWVRAKWVQTPDQGAFLMNDQLRTLKAGELALKALLPQTHRAVRRVYNRAGPRLAARLQNPWLADAAYAALVPAELLTRAAFWILGLRPMIRADLKSSELEPGAC